MFTYTKQTWFLTSTETIRLIRDGVEGVWRRWGGGGMEEVGWRGYGGGGVEGVWRRWGGGGMAAILTYHNFII